ncbi:hypothetical protein IscW_ISCW011234 [Ixodes scapularis]|uniref:Uncharacterized protein n=1 Tax=Ixodes scapularis TaxID=6945 RepID=B7Q851_IXOSC|nr:hypothetical protein IscW_ISCW011234 [Ixodes scapularis]|eukprot:XP_002412287.1 hypothetical protein IscW_ISCW011234 [Ixodes scapularis]
MPALSRPWASFSGTVPPAVPAAGSQRTGRQPDDKDRGDVDDADGEPAAAHLLECLSLGAAVPSGRRHSSGQGAIPLPGLHRQRDELRCPGADAQPDINAVYCDVCGGLVVLEQQHVLSLDHCAQRVPGVDAVLARVHRAPSLRRGWGRPCR